MSLPSVLIMMGSKSDLPVMEEAKKALAEFGIKSEMHISSAHRGAEKVALLTKGARLNGFGAIIAGAGSAAHLAGAIAAHTTLPVIGVPLEASSLQGLDSLLSTVQMPAGVPVASMAIGKAGARNAGIFAAQIIGVADAGIASKLEAAKKEMARKVEEMDKELAGG